MAQPQTQEMYFFIKMVPRDRGGMQPLTTVIWSVDCTGEPRGVNVSNSLASGGAMKDVVAFEVYRVEDPNMSEQAARALMSNPTFNWARDALAISFHKITVAGGGGKHQPFVVK